MYIARQYTVKHDFNQHRGDAGLFLYNQYHFVLDPKSMIKQLAIMNLGVSLVPMN